MERQWNRPDRTVWVIIERLQAGWLGGGLIDRVRVRVCWLRMRDEMYL